MLKCPGEECPIKENCYRFTQPYAKRDRFGEAPYNFTTNHCEHFYSNEPQEEDIRLAAYHLWLREGKPENKALEHWHQAYLSLYFSTGKLKP